MGSGNLVINVAWKAVVVVVYAGALRAHAAAAAACTTGGPGCCCSSPTTSPTTGSTASRTRTASSGPRHVVHHSSQHYNLSTALRQTWVPMTYLPFWLPLLLLGFPPWAVLLQQSVSLIYQFGLHTERIGRLPRWVEAVLNTPSHHRVHHGANPQYLDRNYGGILVIWDRLFGTLEPERRARALRPDDEPADVQPGATSPSTSTARWRATSAPRRTGAPAPATCSTGRAGSRTPGRAAPERADGRGPARADRSRGRRADGSGRRRAAQDRGALRAQHAAVAVGQDDVAALLADLAHRLDEQQQPVHARVLVAQPAAVGVHRQRAAGRDRAARRRTGRPRPWRRSRGPRGTGSA